MRDIVGLLQLASQSVMVQLFGVQQRNQMIEGLLCLQQQLEKALSKASVA